LSLSNLARTVLLYTPRRSSELGVGSAVLYLKTDGTTIVPRARRDTAAYLRVSVQQVDITICSNSAQMSEGGLFGIQETTTPRTRGATLARCFICTLECVGFFRRETVLRTKWCLLILSIARMWVPVNARSARGSYIYQGFVFTGRSCTLFEEVFISCRINCEAYCTVGLHGPLYIFVCFNRWNSTE